MRQDLSLETMDVVDVDVSTEEEDSLETETETGSEVTALEAVTIMDVSIKAEEDHGDHLLQARGRQPQVEAEVSRSTVGHPFPGPRRKVRAKGRVKVKTEEVLNAIIAKNLDTLSLNARSWGNRGGF